MNTALHHPIAGFVLVALVVCSGAARPAVAGGAAAALGPQQLITQVVSDLLAALDKDRAAIRQDPTAAQPLIDKIVLPHFDTQYAARLILAQTWRTASSEQRKRFVAALYRSLLVTYGSALADLTSDRLKVLPMRDKPGANSALVRTLVRRDSGAEIPVDYRMHKTTEGWEVYDVIIEGISYVLNCRADIGEEVQQKGLDDVIRRLEGEPRHVGQVRQPPRSESR